jgi:type III pantothenate kinase
MQLAIDIGNSALKYALFDDLRIVAQGTGKDDLTGCIDKHRTAISRAIMSSVADSIAVIELIRKFNIPLTILSHETKLPILNLYKTPLTLGSDRITLAVAADRMYDSAPALVIGAGTCITYNFTDQGSFIGGAISPGITMRFQSLQHYTDQLPYVDWAPHRDIVFDGLIGADSDGSILSGVLNGVLQEINGTIDQYRQRYSGLRVAVTGGDMPFLVKNLKNDIFARPDMVLEGLNYILLHHA